MGENSSIGDILPLYLVYSRSMLAQLALYPYRTLPSIVSQQFILVTYESNKITLKIACIDFLTISDKAIAQNWKFQIYAAILYLFCSISCKSLPKCLSNTSYSTFLSSHSRESVSEGDIMKREKRGRMKIKFHCAAKQKKFSLSRLVCEKVTKMSNSTMRYLFAANV